MSFTYFLPLIFLLNFHQLSQAENLDHNPHSLETYIVHVDGAQSDDLETLYDSYLPTNLPDSPNYDRPKILYRYRNVFSGFAAKLSAEHVEAMKQKEGFISARPERLIPLHTTHSPNFLGLNQNRGFWRNSNYGKGVIIGVLDSGITPGHPSFSDAGVPPPPAKWKGKCDRNFARACNKKLIGFRHFSQGDQSPVDVVGHGTHTASTAAGNFVPAAGIFGNANGTAAGIAPFAHLAIYRVCNPDGCSESDLVAGIDAAIDDGIDILSVSLGGEAVPFHSDVLAIGAYRATQRGILVSCSAGNDGPISQTINNEAPWVLTVGASTTDRKIRSTALLGNGEKLYGETLKGFRSLGKLDLVYLGNVSEGKRYYCDGDDELSPKIAKGKVVLCDNGGDTSGVEKGEAVKNAGGAAMILSNPEILSDTIVAQAHVLPTVQITYDDSTKIKAYVDATRGSATAQISFEGTVIGDDRAPVVAAFSSRGPSNNSPGVLKPDIIGPGVNILAAWPVSIENKTDTKATFNVISGTSMSCPHLSGVAALLKSTHPDWSPAAIKSAIMTTAYQANLGGKPIDSSIFNIGAGHVNPSRADEPGLVYDIQPDDYVPYLCGLNYTNQQVGLIVQRRVDCAKEKSIPDGQLNYPAFSVTRGPRPQTYTRKLTNVGEPVSTYKVEIVSPEGVTVKVEPQILRFSKVGQKLSYKATFTRAETALKPFTTTQGFINWNSSKYSVRTAVAVIIAS